MENLSWDEEARAVISDISSSVASAGLSAINNTKDFGSRIAYINIETKESEKLTVRLDCEGFSVVGRKFDDKSLLSPSNLKYETIYALLNYLSPSYTLTFAQNLSDRLSKLTNGAREANGK
ncbi:GSK3-beta interaction protein [Orchesella cincta]|uniref:GSK3-beta interaction protein n=1 Tax=Orchesella cincta TaxID=48709 RepID=A0A1D2NLG4_ORCCI|nr:GSK3-beta interaction protein [Orchesella cincta]